MDHMRRLFAGLLVLGVAACGTINPSKPPPVYVVFFVGQSVELTADGHKIIAAAAAEANHASMIQVAGPSTQITPHYDPGLAEPRMKLVEKELIADGVPPDKLARASLTSDNVMVNTSGAQRVEIRIIK